MSLVLSIGLGIVLGNIITLFVALAFSMLIGLVE